MKGIRNRPRSISIAYFFQSDKTVLFGGLHSSICQRGLDHDGALQPFLFQLTREGVGLKNIPLILLVVGVAAAGAIKFRPAFPAFLFAVNRGPGKSGLLLQIVIAGKTEAVAEAARLAKEKGAKLAVKLKVSGPFHTSLLQPASDRLKPELEKMHISDMKIPVYTNVNAQVVPSKDDIIPILTKQICCPVRWADIIRNMNEQGADTFIELGPGKALTGFVKRTLKGVNIMNVEDLSSLDKTIKKLHEIV